MGDELIKRVELVQKLVGIFLTSRGKYYDLELLAHLLEERDSMGTNGEIMSCELSIFVAKRGIYILLA